MVDGYPSGLGGWGVGGIFKEAGRLMVKYAGLLAPFVFAFVLPMALVQLAEVLGAAWWAGNSPFLPPGPHHASFHLSSMVGDGMEAAYPPLPPVPSGKTLLAMLGLGLLMWLLVSLAVASIAKTVQYIYSNNDENPSLTKSIFQSLPHALWRLLVTSVWILLLTLITAFTISLPFYLISLILGNKHAHLLTTIQGIVLSVSLTILSFLFLLSQEVAVLEPDHYGLEALKRSAKLVQEKLGASLVLFLLTVGVGELLGSLSTMKSPKLPQWSMYLLAVLIVLLYLAYMVYMLLAAVVLYFSSKLQYDAEDELLPEFRYRSGDNPYTPLVVPAENRDGLP